MSSDANDRPNILLILTDQQRSDTLGCYGASWVNTPNLDRLGREGAIFENCYVNNTICTPSRASIWTGKELPGHGVYKLYDELPPGEVHFTQRLKEGGYRTALYGKLHTSGRLFEAYQRHPTDGFEEYEWGLEASIHLDSPFNGYSRWLQEKHSEFFRELLGKGRDLLHHPQEAHFTHWAAERTIDFIRRAGENAPGAGRVPFFCCMSVFDPHNPYEDYPKEMLGHLRQEDMPERLADLRRDRPEGIERERNHSYLGGFASLSAEEIGAMRVGYYASVALIDLEVGRVLDSLVEAGVADNTLVLFASDHGDMIGDHDLLVKGGFFYEAAVKVPFLIRWPQQLKGGTRVSAVVQPHDIAATILEAAGLMTPEISREMPTSRDLLPLAGGDVEAVRSHAVCAYRNSGICDTKRPWDPPIDATMVTDGRYKLSLYHGDRGELYDLQEDPQELRDLYSESGSCHERVRLTESLVEWLQFHERNNLGTRGGERLPGLGDQIDNRLKRSSFEGRS